MLVHVKVYGRVQGVGFRAWARREASRLSLSGWVRNRVDGCVEIIAEGERDNILLFLDSCHKGPLWSRVQRVEPVSIPDAFVPPVESGIFCIHASV